MMLKTRLLHHAAMLLPLAAAACGGGGGVNATPTPPAVTPTPTVTPAPTPTPAPAPTPTATNYDTAEYRATVGAVSMNALAAYQKGATGAGVGIGIIDSGIDLQSPEFGNRISAASVSVAGNDSIDDQGGHGTAVAFTAAGRRNDTGSHGVAFDATLIVLRADRPGTCSSTSTDDADNGCKFGTDAIAKGVDVARTAGARVINISLGGSEMPANLQSAIGRATAAGIVVVIAAGNDGTANPDGFTSVANNDAIARNQVIIAGWVNSDDSIADGSDRAGTSAAHYLGAVGTRVRAPNQDNVAYLWSGTSFAAPQISGAVALLAQAFPNLSGAQIVDLLFRTARDAGTPGVDAIYGRGVLDLTRAFQPVGTTTVAGSAAVASLTGGGTLSAPMGDAHQTGLGAVILDGYDRAFAIDLANTLKRSTPAGALAGTLQFQGRSVALERGGTAVSMTLAPRANGDAILQRSALTRTDAIGARAIAGSVVQRLGSDLSFGFAFAQGATVLTAQLTGLAEPAFLVAGNGQRGFDGAARTAAAVRQRFGAWGLTTAIESGRVASPRDQWLPGAERSWRSGFERGSVAIDRRFGALATQATVSRLAESDTILGARLGTGLGATRATSWFAEGTARFEPGDGWTLGGSLRRGWTDADVRGGLTGSGLIRTIAFAADLGKTGLFGVDSIGLRIAQPLRVARGGVDFVLPTGWDYATSSVTAWTTQRLNMAPGGRELDVEARYAVRFGPGTMQTNLFWRRDPGNIAALAPDYGLALRYGLAF